jgi:hypothetical protein
VATLDGRPLHAEPTSEGLRVELVAPLSAERPTVMALRDVEARSRVSAKDANRQDRLPPLF